jgi:hypothetical protein
LSALFAEATLTSSSEAVSFADPAKRVTQDQHRALPRRQELDCGEEGKLDRLLRDECGFRLGLARGDPFQQPIRVGLQPGQVDGGGHRQARIRRRRDLIREHATRLAVERLETRVRRDPVKPRPKRGATLEAAALTPGAQQRFLHQIFRILERTEHPVAVHL